MYRAALLFCWLIGARAFAANYELTGQIVPEVGVSVSLHGASSRFGTATLADVGGRFRFRMLAAGAYTVTAFTPERGVVRQTVEVGPGVADSRGRVTVTLQLESATMEADDAR